MNADLLIRTLRNNHYLSISEEKSIESILFRRAFNKSQIIHEEGQVCRYLYFIDSGFISSYFNGLEGPVCFWLARTGDFMTSTSFFGQKRSGEVLRAEEDTEVACFAYPALMKLMESNENIRRTFLSFCFRYEAQLFERLRSLLEDSAAERVRKLFEQYPDILQKVSAGYAASYLGVRRTSFFKLKNKLK